MSKAVLLIQSRNLLVTHGIQPDPLWQAMLSLVWAGLFWGAAWLLRQRRPFTQYIIPLLLLFFGFYTVSLRLIFSPLPFATNGGFAIMLFFLTMVALAFLALQQAGRRHYFVERREYLEL